MLYAEVVFQHYYKDKTWVNGKYVSDNIRADISKRPVRRKLFDIMGENGLGAQTSFTRNFDGWVRNITIILRKRLIRL